MVFNTDVNNIYAGFYQEKGLFVMMTLEKLKVIGDRVLISVDSSQDQTSSGLILPVTVTEKETVQSGYVVAVGPGTPMADPEGENNVWEHGNSKPVKYLPLEVEVGDYALYLKKFAIDIKYQNQNYIIVPLAGILVIERDDSQIDLSQILK